MTSEARVLYFDCFSGLAGDMTLGGLLDLGLPFDELEAALRTLPVDGWTISQHETLKMGIRGIDVHITVDGEVEGPAVPANGDDLHSESLTHHGLHGHRHYGEIISIFKGGDLPAPVVERALKAFNALADAEARIHGIDREAVHFHEVGAVDSIIDIAGAAWGLWKLGIDRIESAPPPMGRGFVRCAHGRMPLPAPATLELLKGVPVSSCTLERELVTPTGAAFIKAWCDAVGPMPSMTIEGIGWGAGNADFEDRPNLLRLVMGRTVSPDGSCVVVETNLDDFSPELAGFLLERLFESGALDAWFVPIQMKKNRPAMTVGALVDSSKLETIKNVLLAESSAIGLRHYPVDRTVLDRRHETVETPFGSVAVKIAYRDGEVLNIAPEYEECAALARRSGVPLKTIYQHAISSWRNDPVKGR